MTRRPDVQKDDSRVRSKYWTFVYESTMIDPFEGLESMYSYVCRSKREDPNGVMLVHGMVIMHDRKRVKQMQKLFGEHIQFVYRSNMMARKSIYSGKDFIEFEEIGEYIDLITDRNKKAHAASIVKKRKLQIQHDEEERKKRKTEDSVRINTANGFSNMGQEEFDKSVLDALKRLVEMNDIKEKVRIQKEKKKDDIEREMIFQYEASEDIKALEMLDRLEEDPSDPELQQQYQEYMKSINKKI